MVNMKRFNMETMKNKRTLLIIIVTILIVCACIGIYKHNSKPEIKNATTTKTVSSNKSKNNKKTTDIKPENKSRETEEKEDGTLCARERFLKRTSFLISLARVRHSS